MISLVFTSTQMIATLHTAAAGKPLFRLPREQNTTSYAAAAAQVKQALKACNVKARRISITLMDDVVFKEFSHQPVAEKAVAGFARLEARTVLREQYDHFSVSHLPFGAYQNAAKEHVCLLLATPLNILKSIEMGFAGEGFSVACIHSGFDAFAAACAMALPTVMGDKTYAAIDFGYDYTLINIYANGLLVSQRRLPGLSASLLPTLVQAMQTDEKTALKTLETGEFAPEFAEEVQGLATSFIWDILRTVRVVCAPIHLELEAFFISGDACANEGFRAMAVDNLGLPCVFVDDVQLPASIAFKKPLTAAFINIGGAASKLDLLGALREAKKSTRVNTFTCAAVTALVAIGLLAQPFAVALKTQSVAAIETRLAALSPVANALAAAAEAQTRVLSIDNKLAALKDYTSNMGETLPDVQALFTDGLMLESISYDGTVGQYDVQFKTKDIQLFLQLKEKIYQNKGYYLNLTLSSDLDETGLYNCRLSFTPSSYIALPAPTPAPEQTPVETTPEDLLQDIGGNN